jgi:hypothetical protein
MQLEGCYQYRPPPVNGFLNNSASTPTAETPSIEGLTTWLGSTHHKEDILEGKNNKDVINMPFLINFPIQLIH